MPQPWSSTQPITCVESFNRLALVFKLTCHELGFSASRAFYTFRLLDSFIFFWCARRSHTMFEGVSLLGFEFHHPF